MHYGEDGVLPRQRSVTFMGSRKSVFRGGPAMALGVLRPFAAAFGKRKLEQCPYLVTPVQGRKTAAEWAYLMVTAADRMDARFRRTELERWLPVKFR